MRYFKYLGAILTLLFCTNNCFAENWVIVEHNGSNYVYLDIDSINYHNNSLYYNIKMITYNTDNDGIYSTIQSMGDSAGVVESFKYKDYKIHEKALTPKVATSFKIVTEDSLIYTTNLKANELYQLSKQKNNEDDINFEPYIKGLQRHIKHYWTPPKGTKNLYTIVMLKISKDGRLLSHSILKTSGNKNFDREVLNAVEIAAPFNPLPKKFNGTNIDVQFTFDYNGK